MNKYVIEREIENVGALSEPELGDAAKTSNAALAQIKDIQWQYSYVTENKTFCIYLADSEELIREHARLSGFPASKITEVKTILDPTSENKCGLAQAVA